MLEEKAPELQSRIMTLLKQSRLPATWLPEIRCYASLSSTMDRARELIKESLPTPFIVQADRQTDGRGRQGRSWSGLHSGLYTTIVFSSPVGSLNLSGFSLMVGLALHNVLSKYCPGLQLKWPNDLLDQRERKLAGVLIETTSNSHSLYILTGIGVNISGTLPGGLQAVTLAELAAELTIDQLLVGIYRQLVADWDVFKTAGFSKFRNGWLDNYAHKDRRVEIKTGHSVVTGTAIDVDSTGALIVREDSGSTRLITVGDVNAL